jgi:hypothetical protein
MPAEALTTPNGDLIEPFRAGNLTGQTHATIFLAAGGVKIP